MAVIAYCCLPTLSVGSYENESMVLYSPSGCEKQISLLVIGGSICFGTVDKHISFSEFHNHRLFGGEGLASEYQLCGLNVVQGLLTARRWGRCL
jgi:hypothetical protein